MAFGGHLGSFWRGFGPQNGAQKQCKKYPKTVRKIYSFLDEFWTNFGVHSGAKNCSSRWPKMGPLLEPPCPASQGSRPRPNRNYTRGVQKLLELELYSTKEREWYINIALSETFFIFCSALKKSKRRVQKEAAGDWGPWENYFIEGSKGLTVDSRVKSH